MNSMYHEREQGISSISKNKQRLKGKTYCYLSGSLEKNCINEVNIQPYTMDGREDTDRILIVNARLKCMVSKLQDFEAENHCYS